MNERMKKEQESEKTKVGIEIYQMTIRFFALNFNVFSIDKRKFLRKQELEIKIAS